MGREIDFGALIRGMGSHRKNVKTRDIVAVMQAMSRLRRSSLPQAYVDGLQDEILQMMCDRVPDEACDFVYLAFHGDGGHASHMKIGMAKDVRKRMSALYTGNPLPRLWVYAARIAGREVAQRIERELLLHMSKWRAEGEWVSVGGVNQASAEAITSSLAEVASLHTTQPVEFEIVEL